jgi:hypothetical protein
MNALCSYCGNADRSRIWWLLTCLRRGRGADSPRYVARRNAVRGPRAYPVRSQSVDENHVLSEVPVIPDPADVTTPILLSTGLRSQRPSRPWPLALLSLIGPVGAAALTPVQAQQSGFGTISGVAADSLHVSPLAGALVSVVGVGRSVVTDAEGLFTIDSIPAGSVRLAVFHPLLDTVGISLVTEPLGVTSDSTVNVIVAVPSTLTVLRLKCGNDAASAILGSVTRADDPSPPVGAFVRLSWTEVEVGRGIGIRQTPREMTSPVDADGAFRLCSIPVDIYGELVAYMGADTSAALPAGLGEEPTLALVGLTLPGADVERVEIDLLSTAEGDSAAGGPAPDATTASSMLRGRAVIQGRVVDSVGRAVAGARVALQGAVGASTTDSAGTFTLTDQPSGSGILITRKLGFPMTEMPITVTATGLNEVTVRMESGSVMLLSEVVVTANRQMALERVGFFRRQQGRRGNLYLDVDQMDAMSNRASLANVLAGASNLTYRLGRIVGRPRAGRVTVGANREVGLSGSYTCVAYVVDGRIWPPNTGDPTEFMMPNEIAAIEVYRAGDVPQTVPDWLYARNCETVVIWTRFHIARGGTRRSR